MVSTIPESLLGVLDKRRTIAGPGLNRWLVPPAALCVHLCIGMASPMLQEVCGGRLLGLDIPFEALDAAQLGRVAGILGPVLVNYVNEQQLWAGVPRAAAYDRTMMLLAGLLAMGFVCNALIRPVGPTDMEPEAAGVAPRPSLAPVTSSPGAATAMRPVNLLLLTGFWLFVTIPMGWGLWATIRQAAVLFW